MRGGEGVRHEGPWHAELRLKRSRGHCGIFLHILEVKNGVVLDVAPTAVKATNKAVDGHDDLSPALGEPEPQKQPGIPLRQHKALKEGHFRCGASVQVINIFGTSFLWFIEVRTPTTTRTHIGASENPSIAPLCRQAKHVAIFAMIF